VLLFYLIAEHISGVRQVTLIYASFSLAALWTAAALVWAFFAEPDGQPGTWVSEVAGTILVVPNDVTFLAVIAPLSLALLCRRPRTPLALLAALSMLFSLAAIALMQSRSALLTFLVSTAFAAGLLRPRLGVVWVVAVLVIVTIVDGLLGFPLLAKFRQFAGTRIPLWLAAWEMFRDAPFLGQGPHTYELAYESYLAGSDLPDRLKIDPRRTPWPHNLYLEVLAEQGLIGLGALGALLAAGARLGWRLRTSAPRELRLYGIAALSALTGFCFAALLESSFLRLWVMITLFVLLGLLAQLSRTAKGMRNSDDKDIGLGRE
jgi:O-antigen ligase